MVMALISLLLLLLLAGLWLIEVLLHVPTPGALSLGQTLQAETPLALYAHLGLAALGCLGAVGLRRRQPGLSQATLLLSALAIGNAARLSWEPGSLFHPADLWCLAIALSVVAGLLFRAEPDVTPILTSPPHIAASERSLSSGIWVGICAVLATSAAVLTYRIVDTPGEFNAFGLQALVSARRLLHGEIALKELILLREMTQEECGYSLPYVLWHALFQILFGGLSILETRVACAVISWLSIVWMFRVARALAGPLYGLIAMTVYALMPLTLFTARSEGIFAFSALLLLISTDIILAFMRRPSTLRAVLVGVTIPLCAYGLANIKLMLLAPLATTLVAMLWSRELRRNSWRLGYSVIVTAILFIPQFMNFSLVKQQVQGRGEHIFGNYFLQSFYGNYERIWETRAEILLHNAQLLGATIFGPWNEKNLSLDHMIALPSVLTVPLVVGLSFSLTRIYRPYRFFIVAFFCAAYLGPFISTSPSLNRRYLFSLAQTLIIASVWLDCILAFRTAPLRRILLCATGVTVALSMGMGILASWQFLNQQWTMALVKEYVLRNGEGRVVFFPDGRETYYNYLLWNPPTLGRTSEAHIPVVGIRYTSAEATRRIADELGIPAIILSEKEPTFDSAGWTVEKTPSSMWALTSPSRPNSSKPVVVAIDPIKLTTQSPLLIERLSYNSDDLFDARIEHPASTRTFEVPVDIERATVLVRSSSHYPPPIPVTILFDNGATQLTKSTEFSAESGAHYYVVEDLKAGTHTISLEASTPNDISWVDDVVIIGIAKNN